MSPEHYVVMVAASRGADLKLPAPELARTGSYDVAIWREGEAQNVRLVGEWYWDNAWQHLVSANSLSLVLPTYFHLLLGRARDW